MSRTRVNRWLCPACLPDCAWFVWAAQGCFTTTSETTACTNGSNTGRIRDYSGNLRHFDNTVAGRYPIWESGGLNSKPSWLFDGVDDRMLSPSFSFPQPCTIIMVGQSGGGGYFVDSIAGNGRVVYGDAAALSLYGGSAFVLGPTFDTSAAPFFGATVFDGTRSIVGTNDVFGTSADGGSDTATTGMILGDYGASVGGAALNGRLGMAAGFTGTLTSAQLTFCYRWAKQAFGL